MLVYQDYLRRRYQCRIYFMNIQIWSLKQWKTLLAGIWIEAPSNQDGRLGNEYRFI